MSQVSHPAGIVQMEWTPPERQHLARNHIDRAKESPNARGKSAMAQPAQLRAATSSRSNSRESDPYHPIRHHPDKGWLPQSG